MASPNLVHYFDKLYISDITYPSQPQSYFRFSSKGIALSVEATVNPADVILYSFNGYDDAGDLSPTEVSRGIVFDNREQDKVYFRRKTVGSPVLVRVEAWRT